MANLVAYFSCSGVTAHVAQKLANVLKGDLFEIVPKDPYTSADLNWNNSKSRSSIEMNDPHSRPEIASHNDQLDQYDTIYIGFPIWWYTAPTIIHTFLESYDFSNKNIVVFATSGGSGLGHTIQDLQKTCPKAHFIGGQRLNANISEQQLKAWIKEF